MPGDLMPGPKGPGSRALLGSELGLPGIGIVLGVRPGEPFPFPGIGFTPGPGLRAAAGMLEGRGPGMPRP